MNEQVQAIERLQHSLKWFSHELDMLLFEFNQEVEATIATSQRSRVKPSIELASWNAIQKHKENLRDELRGAIFLGSEHSADLFTCRKLVVALESVGVDPLLFVFDAVVELERLIEMVLSTSPSPEAKIDDELEQAIKLWNSNPKMTKKALEKSILHGNASHASHRSFFDSVKSYSDKRYGEGHLRGGKIGSPRIERNRHQST
jgi:hypothetical protein